MIVGILFMSLNAWAVNSKELIVDRGIFIDPTGRMQIQDVLHAKYQPFSKSFDRAWTEKTRWIRLTVQAPGIKPTTLTPDRADRINASAQDTALELRIGPHFLSDIQLYEERNGSWVMHQTGSLFPNNNQNCVEYVYCFNLNVPKGETVNFYVRLRSLNGYYLTSQAMVHDDSFELSANQNKIAGLMLGIVLMTIFWSMLQYIKNKDPVLGSFTLSQICSLAFTLSGAGTLASFVFYDAPQLDVLTFNVLLVARIIAILFFSYSLLQKSSPPAWYRRVYFIVMGYLFLDLIAVVCGYLTAMALTVNLIILGLLPVVEIYVAWRAKKLDLKMRRFIIGGFFFVALLIWGDLLGLSNFQKSDLLVTPAQLSGFIGGLIMYFLVLKSSTINRNTFKRTLAEMDALRTKSHLEHQQFVERSMLIDMLTHELKTPLATLRMAAGSLNYVFSQPENFDQTSAKERLNSIAESISSMDAVLERCIQVDQLDQKKFSIRPEFVDMESLILDLPIIQLNRSRLKLTIPDNLVVEVDPQLFSMITTNLIDNAMKYSHWGSSIDLRIQLDDAMTPESKRNHIVLTVDNHIGVSGAPEASQLFTRYYRSTYAHNISGTGLGLYLIRSICTLLGGSIEYQPHENLVRFVVRLPV